MAKIHWVSTFARRSGQSYKLFKWFSKAEESEINDPNAVAVATSNKNNQPNVRMVLLKGLSERGFVFYTNFNSRKGNELKENQKAQCASMEKLKTTSKSYWKG